MTSRCNSAIPQHDVPGLCLDVSHREKSGRGECRVPTAPAASCAKVESTRVVTTVAPEHPAFPHAMVLTAASYSPRRSGFLVTVIGEISFTNLTPASRRQDHTTSPSASQAPLVKSAARVHRIPSRVRDDRDTPLQGDGTAVVMEVIWVGMKSEYFFWQDWTGQITLIPRENFSSSDIPEWACYASQSVFARRIEDASVPTTTMCPIPPSACRVPTGDVARLV